MRTAPVATSQGYVRERRGEACSHQTCADDDDVEVHGWIVLADAFFLDKYLMRKG